MERRKFLTLFGYGATALVILPKLVIPGPELPGGGFAEIPTLYFRWPAGVYPLMTMLREMGHEISEESAEWRTFEEDWYTAPNP